MMVWDSPSEATLRSKREGRTSQSALLLPLHQEPRYLAQGCGALAELVERGVGLSNQLIGLLQRRLDAEERGIRRFVVSGVFARGLTQLLRGLGDVEHVIHDLKREPDVLSEAAQVRDLRLAGVRVHATGHHAGSEQRARLGAMDVLQRLRVGMDMLGLE